MGSVWSKAFKRFIDARWAWDMVAGPVYNRVIADAASGLYDHFMEKVRAPSGARILDVGCGPGLVSLLLSARDPTVSVVGVDYSRTQVRTAERNRRERVVPGCSFRRANAMSLPFDDAHFDVVVSIASMKHWPDAGKALSEIRRVLRSKGTVYIAEADRKSAPSEQRRFEKGFRAWFLWRPFTRWLLHNVVFGQSLSAGEARDCALDAGFRWVSVEEVPLWPFFLLRARK